MKVPDSLTDEQVLFLGHDMTVSVFTSIDDLATFCRAAEDHDLMRLELWDRVRIEEDDDAFAPDAASQYDLTAPSGDGEAGRSTAGVDTTPRGRPTVAASPRLTGRVGSSGLAGRLDAASAAEPRAGASASCSAVVPPGVDCRSGMR